LAGAALSFLLFACWERKTGLQRRRELLLAPAAAAHLLFACWERKTGLQRRRELLLAHSFSFVFFCVVFFSLVSSLSLSSLFVFFLSSFPERKAHLQRQREMLVAAKKKEREETMKEYQAKKQANGGIPGLQ